MWNARLGGWSLSPCHKKIWTKAFVFLWVLGHGFIHSWSADIQALPPLSELKFRNYLERQGEFVRRLMTPITHIVTLYVTFMNLLTTSPDPPGRVWGHVWITHKPERRRSCEVSMQTTFGLIPGEVLII